MDLVKLKDTVKDLVRRYRAVLIVILAGILLMGIPERPQKESAPVPDIPPPDFQQSLEDLLSQIEGAGKVRLLLSEEMGAMTIYEHNEDRNGNGSDLRKDTVIIQDRERGQKGLVRQVAAPRYRGAVVLAQGAGDPRVKLDLVNAVSRAAGIRTDKIYVLKMK